MKAMAHSKMPRVDKATLKQRLDTCKTCEYLIDTRLPQAKKCSQCGCFVHLKAVYPKSACPMGKW